MMWFLLIGIGILTFTTRLSFIIFLGKVTISPRIKDILRFVPVAVLSAIILPQLILVNNTFNMSLTNPRWIAGGIAAIVAWRTRNVLLTIAVGMGTLWILQALLG